MHHNRLKIFRSRESLEKGQSSTHSHPSTRQSAKTPPPSKPPAPLYCEWSDPEPEPELHHILLQAKPPHISGLTNPLGLNKPSFIRAKMNLTKRQGQIILAQTSLLCHMFQTNLASAMVNLITLHGQIYLVNGRAKLFFIAKQTNPLGKMNLTYHQGQTSLTHF